MIIHGKWRQGRVLDYHTVHSTFIGYDAFGNPQFDTKRTPLGEALYRLKYSSDMSVLSDIVETAADFLSRTWRPPCALIVPVPPSRLQRTFQPVVKIAELLSGSLRWEFASDSVRKNKSTPELKNVYDYHERLTLLEDAFEMTGVSVKQRTVLLFDDLYRSGATLNAITAALLDKGGAAAVHVLALTRTRGGS